MDVNRRRVGVRSSVVAGSVWESRMLKNDELGEENAESGKNLKRSSNGVLIPTGKRKTWKSEKPEGLGNSQIQITRGKTEPLKNSSHNTQQCNNKDLNFSSDATIKKSPIQRRKVKIEGSPIQNRKVRSEVQNGSSAEGESGEGSERNIGNFRKSKLDSIKSVDGEIGENAEQLRKEKSKLDDESRNGIDGKKSDSDENCKEFGVCQEKVITSSSENVGLVKISPLQVDGDSDDDEDEREEVDDEIDIEMEQKSFDVKEISIPESMVVNESEKQKIVNESEKQKIVNESEKQKFVNESEPKKAVSNTNRRFHQKNVRPVSVPLTVKQSPPIRKHSSIYQNFSNANSIPKEEEYHDFPQTQNKLQSLVDLIMWRDISRSAFIFGIGIFTSVSSSYAKDINLSLISIISYMGLVYLAVIFLYRSLICRGVIDVEDTNYVLGEDDAIWVLKLVLPYLNEFLSKFKAMFSGDPGTTIKLAVLLFVLARSGNSITIWKMAKIGFFGVFTVPKICSMYSAQLTAYGNFWIRRFQDAWDSCSHKKAVALGIFTLVWNLSSVVARVWSVFVLFVAFKYYQQHYMVRDELEEDEAECDETWQETEGVKVRMQRQEMGPNLFETQKVKKGF